MKRELTAQVGADGVLTLTVPLGREDANKTVRVVVETVETPAGPVTDPDEWRGFVERVAGSITDPTFMRHPQTQPFTSREEWLRFIEATSGKWQGEFVREPEGGYEERDPL